MYRPHLPGGPVYQRRGVHLLQQTFEKLVVGRLVEIGSQNRR